MAIKRSEHPKKLSGQRNQCPSCLEYFNSNTGFDAHRRNRGKRAEIERCRVLDFANIRKRRRADGPN